MESTVVEVEVDKNQTQIEIINDKEEFKMPDNKMINNVIFSTHFLAFVKGSVKKSILDAFNLYSDNGEYKNKSKEEVRDMIREGNIIFEKTANYLNTCWKHYSSKTGENNYVIEKFDYIIKYGKFLHPSCAFYLVWDFSQMLLVYTMGRIDLPELKDEQFLGDTIDIIMDAILSLEVENLLARDIACGDKCTPYDFKQGKILFK